MPYKNEMKKKAYLERKSKAVTKWRRRTKLRIVMGFGGRCAVCGYSRCNRALEAHHIDPKEKKFSFGKVRGNPAKWSSIVIELRKCILLCSNCHKEIEEGVAAIPSNFQIFDSLLISEPLIDDLLKVYLQENRK